MRYRLSMSITRPGKGEYMSVRTETSTQVIGKLKSWMSTNVNIAGCVKNPAGFKDMSDGERKRAQDADRTEAARNIVDRNINVNQEFTTILGALCDLRASKCKETYCSAVREVIREHQDAAWEKYLKANPDVGRKLAAA